MKFDDLIRVGRIKKQHVPKDEIQRGIERANRDLKTAKLVMAGDWDWGFAVAYNAVLQASRAYMFFEGYRPSSNEGHKNTLAFMKIALGREYEELVTYFDRVRNKRNQAIYDVAGLITETEARNLFAKAVEFVKMIEQRIKKGG